MTPRVRLYAAIAAANHGTTADLILRRGPPWGSRAANAARRELWKRLRDDGFTLNQIGNWTGRHHTTVYHGLRMIQGLPRRGG